MRPWPSNSQFLQKPQDKKLTHQEGSKPHPKYNNYSKYALNNYRLLFHIGIAGNVMVDNAAEEAILLAEIHIPIQPDDFK